MADLMLLEDKLPVLARELAMGIYEVEEILTRYGVSWDEWERLQALPRFQKLLETTSVEWGSTLNTRERIKVKALAGVEDGLSELFRAAKDTRETLASRVEAYKLARVLGGIGEREITEQAEKFTLTINIGDTSTIIGGGVRDVTPVIGSEEQHEPRFVRPHDLKDVTSGVSFDFGGAGLNDDLVAGYKEGVHGEEPV
jgi:hypothetical protein